RERVEARGEAAVRGEALVARETGAERAPRHLGRDPVRAPALLLDQQTAGGAGVERLERDLGRGAERGERGRERERPAQAAERAEARAERRVEREDRRDAARVGVGRLELGHAGGGRGGEVGGE